MDLGKVDLETQSGFRKSGFREIREALWTGKKMALRGPSAPCYVCSLKIPKTPNATFLAMCAPFSKKIALRATFFLL